MVPPQQTLRPPKADPGLDELVDLAEELANEGTLPHIARPAGLDRKVPSSSLIDQKKVEQQSLELADLLPVYDPTTAEKVAISASRQAASLLKAPDVALDVAKTLGVNRETIDRHLPFIRNAAQLGRDIDTMANEAEDPRFAAQDVGSQLARAGGSTAFSLAGMGAGGAVAKVAITGLMGAAQSGIPLYEDILYETGDEKKAMTGLLVGMGLGATEAVGAGRILSNLSRPARSSIIRGLTRIAAEGAEEGLQELVQGIGEAVAKGEIEGKDVDWLRALAESGQAGAIGFALGSGLSGAQETAARALGRQEGAEKGRRKDAERTPKDAGRTDFPPPTDTAPPQEQPAGRTIADLYQGNPPAEPESSTAEESKKAPRAPDEAAAAMLEGEELPLEELTPDVIRAVVEKRASLEGKTRFREEPGPPSEVIKDVEVRDHERGTADSPTRQVEEASDVPWKDAMMAVEGLTDTRSTGDEQMSDAVGAVLQKLGIPERGKPYEDALRAIQGPRLDQFLDQIDAELSTPGEPAQEEQKGAERERKPWELTPDEAALERSGREKIMSGEALTSEEEANIPALQRKGDLLRAATPREASEMTRADFQKWSGPKLSDVTSGDVTAAEKLHEANLLRGDTISAKAVEDRLLDGIVDLEQADPKDRESYAARNKEIGEAARAMRARREGAKTTPGEPGPQAGAEGPAQAVPAAETGAQPVAEAPSSPGVPSAEQEAREDQEDMADLAEEITEAKLAPDLKRRADTHPASGLLNKRAGQRASRRLLRSRRPGVRLVRVRGDARNFKAINRFLSHEEGDKLLSAIGDAWAAAVRPEDVAIHIGGDEFAATLNVTADADVEAIVARMEKAVDDAMARAGVDELAGYRFGMDAGWADIKGTDTNALALADMAADAQVDQKKGKRGLSSRKFQELPGEEQEALAVRAREERAGKLAARSRAELEERAAQVPGGAFGEEQPGPTAQESPAGTEPAGAGRGPVQPAPEAPKKGLHSEEAKAKRAARKKKTEPTPARGLKAEIIGEEVDGLSNAEVLAFPGSALADVKRAFAALMKRLGYVRNQQATVAGTIPTETLTEHLIKKWQDSWRGVKTAQRAVTEAGGVVDEGMDAYLAEEQRRGKTKDRLEALDSKLIRPLVAGLRKDGISPEEAGEALMARHAAERNEIIRLRDKDNDAGSGFTDEEAAAILEKIRKGKRADGFQRLFDRFDALIAETREGWVRDGLKSREEVDELAKRFSTYAPLRSDLSEDERGRATSGTGRGVDVRGNEFKAATGRSTKADAREVLAYAFAQAQSGILRGEKRRVANTFLRFVQANAELLKGFAKVSPDQTKRALVNGVVRKVHDPTVRLADNVIQAGENGEDVLIEIDEKYQPVADALKNLHAEDVGKVIGLLGKATRLLAGLSTRYNPVFPLFNAIRDAAGAFINSTEHGIAFAARTVADTPKALAALTKGKLGKSGGSKWDAYAKEYRESGAPVSFLDLRSFEDQLRLIEKGVRAEAKPGAIGELQRQWRDVLAVVEAANDIVENGVRLSAYVHAREDLGMSPARAASWAKNLTVNFERRGDKGATLNALYMFANAGIQSTARVGQAVRHPAVRKLLAAGFIGAMAWDQVMRQIGGKDDDDEWKWDKIPAHVRRHNLVLMFPGGDRYVTIPTPFVYDWIQTAAQQLSGYLSGDVSGGKALGETMSAAVEAFDPIGSGKLDVGDPASIARTAAPTVLDPLVELATNKDWKGDPIGPDDYGHGKPDSERFWPDVGTAPRAVTQWLNRATGGDEFEPGMIDVSPETVEHFSAFLTGGLGRTVAQLYETTQALGRGKKPELREVPFVNRLLREPSPFASGGDFKDLRNAISAVRDRAIRDKALLSPELGGLWKEGNRLDQYRQRQRKEIDRLEGEARRTAERELDKTLQGWNRRARRALLAK